jgi:hypothetical protein
MARNLEPLHILAIKDGAMDGFQRPLPVGTQDFKRIIKTNSVYVDKTMHIHRLLSRTSSSFFLSRPGRFGKTLLVDTLQQVFSGKRELFDGLSIGNPDNGYSWESFPVVRIDMNAIDSRKDKFEDDLFSLLAHIASVYGIELHSNASVNAIGHLIRGLAMKFNKADGTQGDDATYIDLPRVVILIDEYDFPILDNLDNPDDVEYIRKLLHRFYSAIKASERMIRFSFFTGITKFSQISVFSSLANVVDITLDPDFSSICGFTPEEILSCFGDNIDSTVDSMINLGWLSSDTTKNKFMSEIMAMYDGYSWDGKTRVLNPQSVLNFLQTQAFGDFWIQSGYPSFLHKLNLGNDFYVKLLNDQFSVNTYNVEIEVQDITNIDPAAILFQSGYLTVKDIQRNQFQSAVYRLSIPNTEVRRAVASQILKNSFLPSGSSDSEIKYNPKYIAFFNAFCSRNEKLSENILSSILSEIPYPLFRRFENIFHILLYCYLSVTNIKPVSEAFSDKGRTDMVLTTHQEEVLVIEVKHIPSTAPENFEGETSVGAGTAAGHDGAAVIGITASRHDKLFDKSTEIEDPHIAFLLDRSVKDAFRQISENNYSKPCLGRGNQVYETAVAVYGTSDVMIRFRKATG